MIKVGLIGHDARNPNLGVGALTVSNVLLIQEAAKAAGVEIEISVLAGPSTYPSCLLTENATETTVRPLRKPWEYYRALRRLDAVIDISGGDSFTDIYGPRRISQILLMKYLAIAAGRPLVMAPQTLGPFRNKVLLVLAKGATRLSRLVFARDVTSMDYARTVLSKKDCCLSSDVAMRLPFDHVEKRGEKVKVGINISGLLMNGGYTKNNMFQLAIDYPNVMRELIKEFSYSKEHCEVHLIAHVVPEERGGPEDDYQACLDLAEDFKNLIVAPPFNNPSNAKSYISGMDMFIGARMHACIAAFSTGVPVLPFAYSRKFAGLFGSLGYDWTVDGQTQTEEEMIQRARDLYRSRENVKKEMSASYNRALRRLENYQEGLSVLFKQIDVNLATQR
jgi:polysaccharide pyruvyl transferase WcaK-like protein